MAGIVTNHLRKGGAGCDHRAVTVDLDGTIINLDTMEAELDAQPWTDVEKRQFVLLSLKRLRVLGVTLDAAIGRVCIGEEATNIKQYILLATPITKTNIGTAYVNVPIGLNGERTLIEYSGCTQFRIIVNMNFVGAGPMNLRLVRDGDSALIFESANITTPTGEKELDTDWQPLPPAATGLTLVRFQAKSTTAADDPIFRRCLVLVR